MKKENIEESKVNDSKKEISEEKVKNYTGLKYFLFGVILCFVLLLSLVLFVLFLLPKNQSSVRSYIGKVIREENSNSKQPLVVTESERNRISIVENTQESVVSIAASQLTLKQGEGVSDVSQNIGTGFIVDESGIVVTNQHVVSNASSDYKVVGSNGEEFAVTNILRDDMSDIAILRIDRKDKIVKPIVLGDSDSVAVGQDVIAIGTPLGEYAGSVTIGIISGLDRMVSAGRGWFGSTVKNYEGVIQTDAAINPGNSGGPLINSQGEVIGVNFATTSGVENISFAIPINRVKARLEEYRTYGKFIRPYLGVSYQMISEYEALYYKDVVPGALVVRIDPVSPAYSAGIRRGDFIVEFGGEKVGRSLSEMIAKHKVGTEVEVKIVREGKEAKFTVKLGEME